MPISDNIKYLRVTHGMTQAEFGSIAGVSDKAVCTWENGQKTPRMGAIQKIADYFGIKKSDIIEDHANSALRETTISDQDELSLIDAYRAADPVFRAEAIEMLRRHPQK